MRARSAVTPPSLGPRPSEIHNFDETLLYYVRHIQSTSSIWPKLAPLVAQLGLAGAAVVCGQPLTGNLGSAMAQDKLPTVGKITKTGVKYFDYRVGEGSTPRFALLL